MRTCKHSEFTRNPFNQKQTLWVCVNEKVLDLEFGEERFEDELGLAADGSECVNCRFFEKD